MKNKLIDLIDFEKVNTLLEGFNQSTGFVTAILDLEGNVLSKSGWRQICTEFHRVNPETSKKCTISDTELAGKMAEGEKYHFYKCLNGLVDVAVPIVINGEHIANLFSGQFFFEEPDREFFRKQAEKYKFKNETYLNALEKVPVVSQEKVKTAMDFLLNMTLLISEMTFQKLLQTEKDEALQKSEEQHRSILHTAMDGFWLVDMEGRLLEVNQTYCRMSGYNENELLKMKISDLEDIESAEETSTHFQKIFQNDDDRFETRHRRKDGSIFDLEISVQYRQIDGGRCVVFLKDITSKKILEFERQKFVMLAESSTEFIGMCDLGFQPIYVNPSGIQMVGLPDLEAACRVKVQDYFFPEDQQFMTEDFFPRVLHDGHGNVEIRLRHFQTGEAIWMYYYLYSVRDASGTVVGWATVSRDITERKKAEEKLKENYALLRIAGEKTKLGGWNVNLEENRSYWSDQVAAIHEMPAGYSPLVEDGINFYAPEWQDKITELFTRCAQEGIPYDAEMEIITSTGKRVWVRTIGEALRDDKGKIVKVQGAFQEITERKEREKALQLSEEKFEESFRLSPYLVSLTAMDGKVIEVNDMIFETFGYTREEFLGNNTTVLPIWVHPEERATSIQQLKQDGFLHEMEVQYRKKSGKIGDFLLSATIIEVNEEKILLSIIHDITERKEKEKALKESETKYKGLFISIRDALLIADSNRNIIDCNPTFTSLFGYTLDDIKGKQTSFVYENKEQFNELGQAIKNHAGNSTPFQTTLNYIKKNGDVFPGETGIHYLKNNNEEIIGFIGLIRDITERKENEEQIQRLNEELEEKVLDRTRELEKKFKELERINKLFVDRELRMVELKKKIKDLEVKLKG